MNFQEVSQDKGVLESKSLSVFPFSCPFFRKIQGGAHRAIRNSGNSFLPVLSIWFHYRGS